MNFSAHASALSFPAAKGSRIAISTHCSRDGEAVESVVELRPYEGVVIEYQSLRRTGRTSGQS